MRLPSEPAKLSKELEKVFEALRTVPIGVVVWWPASAEFPEGWMECNGQTLKTSSYRELGALFTKTATTFVLPSPVPPAGLKAIIRT